MLLQHERILLAQRGRAHEDRSSKSGTLRDNFVSRRDARDHINRARALHDDHPHIHLKEQQLLQIYLAVEPSRHHDIVHYDGYRSDLAREASEKLRPERQASQDDND